MNNEEKILLLLEKQGEALAQINQRLDQQGGAISQINQRLDQQGETITQINQRLDRMEGTLDQHSESLSNLTTRVTKIELTQENVVLPRIQALAEGQQTLLETLAPKDRVEALENDVALMKTVIRSLAKEVQELKKAE